MISVKWIPFFLLVVVFGVTTWHLVRHQEDVTKRSFCIQCSSFEQMSFDLEGIAGIKLIEFDRFSAPSGGRIPQDVSFVFGTHGRSLGITGGSFKIIAPSGKFVCEYRAIGTMMLDNSELRFRSEDPCKPTSEHLSASLSISTVSQSKVSLWVRGPMTKKDAWASEASIAFVRKVISKDLLFVPLGFAFTETNEESVAIYRRLAFAWELQDEWLLFASFLFACSFALFSWFSQRIVSRRALVVFGVAALFLSVAISLFSLPFQAPDEPDHALTMANAMNSTKLVQEFENLARKTHLERIKFHPEEKLLTEDLSKPAFLAWSAHVSPTELHRSATSTLQWRTLSSLFSNLSGSNAVLAMRLINCCLFSLAVVYSYWILGSSLGLVHLFSWLVIPTVPFFAMHISNYGPLVSLALVLSASISALVWGQKVPKVGVALGASISFLLATSRSTWAFAPVFGLSLVLGLLIRSDGERHYQKVKYWLAVCLGLSLFWLVSTPDFLDFTTVNVAHHLPEEVRQIFFSLAKTPFVLFPLFIVLMVADCHTILRLDLSSSLKYKVMNLAVYGILFWLLFSYLLPYIKTDLALPNIESESKIHLSGYLKKAIVLALMLFRMSDHDFFMSRSFFGGFGWLESPLPQWTTSLILLMAAGGLLSMVIYIRKTCDFGILIRLLLILLGLILSVAFAAKGNWDESVNLHGRYLIPFYLVLFGICFSGYARNFSIIGSSRYLKYKFLNFDWINTLLFLSVFLHCYSLFFNFSRYFG